MCRVYVVGSGKEVVDVEYWKMWANRRVSAKRKIILHEGGETEENEGS